MVQAPSAPPPPDPGLQSVDLTVHRFNLRHGDKIGQFRCMQTDDILWSGAALNAQSHEFRAIFSEAAQAARIPIVYDPRVLFTDGSNARRPTYAVGASVVSIASSICRAEKRDFINGYWILSYDGDVGKTDVTIDWEIQSVLEGRVVYRTRVTGSFEEKVPQKNAVSIFILSAWRDAAAKIVADPGFREAIAQRPTPGRATPANVSLQEALQLRPEPKLAGALANNIDQVRRATVTIDLGFGHGSGFFVASDGWILTNAHVASGNQMVKVVLADGRILFGQVSRAHQARDVALIKVEGQDFTALPLRETPAVQTEEVYAVGTPIDKKLSGTVTRGIVSQIRSNSRNLTDIQADVAIQPGNSGGPLVDASGNVIGISYSGLGRLNAGLNFFIPIQDALAKLNVSVGGS